MAEILPKQRENQEVLHDQAERREDVDMMIEIGDYEAVVNTMEFGKLSEGGKVELVQRAVANKIEHSNARFFRLIGEGDSENAIRCDDQIKSLQTLQHGLDVYAVQLEMHTSTVDIASENDSGVVSIVESFSSEKQTLSEAA